MEDRSPVTQSSRANGGRSLVTLSSISSEEQININNQNVKAAEAQFHDKDLVRIAPQFIHVDYHDVIKFQRTNGAPDRRTQPVHVRNSLNFPADFSKQANIWGSSRHNVLENAKLAQARCAQLEKCTLGL